MSTDPKKMQIFYTLVKRDMKVGRLKKDDKEKMFLKIIKRICKQ